MLLAVPNIVMLDEATSALDVDTEARLHTALHAHLVDRTVIVIAHRLSAIKQARRVFVLEAGKVAEEGAHAELIGSDGLYTRLDGQAQLP